MKQNKIVAFGMVLILCMWSIFLIGLFLYPFYTRKIEPYPPIDFPTLLNHTIGSQAYTEIYILDKGFLLDQDVIIYEGSEVEKFKNYLLTEKWINIDMDREGREIFCLNPKNKIVFLVKDNERLVGYSFKQKGLEECDPYFPKIMLKN